MIKQNENITSDKPRTHSIKFQGISSLWTLFCRTNTFEHAPNPAFFFYSTFENHSKEKKNISTNCNLINRTTETSEFQANIIIFIFNSDNHYDHQTNKT